MNRDKNLLNHPLKASSGFTLVELLVGSFLGILLLFGVLQIFNSSREGARIQTAMAAVQDSGRIGIEFLSRDIRNADFSGCLLERANLTNGITGTMDPLVHDFYDIEFGPLHGYEADSSITDASDFGGHIPVAGSSVLTVVTARPFCEGVTSIGADQVAADQDLTLADVCTVPDGPVLVADCSNADIFIKTGGGTNGGLPTIAHDDSTFVDGLSNSGIALSNVYDKDAAVFQPVVMTYFIAPGQNGSRALFRLENGTAFELITNVEDFQVTFGINSGAGSADVFIDPATKTAADTNSTTYTDEMASVLSVRVELQVVSDQLIDGQPLRRTYTATTNVRNRVNQS